MQHKLKKSTKVEIREMELDDIAPVFHLGEKLFTAEKWRNLYRTWDEYELLERFLSDREFCLIAEVDEKIVGFAIGALIEKPRNAWVYGYLIWIGIAPGQTGLGIGQKLVNRITKLFKENGARIMLLDTAANNKNAIAFFQKNGFSNLTKHFYFSKNLSARKTLPTTKKRPKRSARKSIT